MGREAAVALELGSKGRIAAALLLLASAPLTTGATTRLAHIDDRLLAAHNRERSALGLPELEWDAALAADAAPWAEHLAALGTLEHAPDADEADPEGENLWLGTKGAYSPEQMVGLWIEEKAHYRAGPIPA